jgi:class 3 adenylate cyclase
MKMYNHLIIKTTAHLIYSILRIGDCYVAVCGLPEARTDHAVVMAKFAKECMKKMNDVTKKLEVSLGPETGDLCMRFGLHSGPVTAGVLRGEKSRFQLFGDTVSQKVVLSIVFVVLCVTLSI